MKKFLIYASALFVLISLQSCQDWLDINVSPNAPSQISDYDLVLADMTATTAYNLVGGGNFTRFSAQWIQHIADASAPPSNDTYRFTTADFNNEWAFTSYAGILVNAKIVIDEASQSERWNHVAIAKILMAHNYAVLTDYFGEIPFSQALKRVDNLTPAYDSQEQVFTGIQQLLDDAIIDIDKNAAVQVGTGDFFFKGDMNKWRRTAYALKARYHLRLTNAPGKAATTQAQLALDAIEKAMTGAADEAQFAYIGAPGTEGPWNQWIAKFSRNIRISDYMVNLLTDLADPRLPVLANTNNGGIYKGYTNGAINNDPLATFSAIGAYYMAPKTSVPLMTYEEQLFLKAEAHLRLGDADAAAQAYSSGVRSHMNRLSGQGQTPTVIAAADVDAYLKAHPVNGLEDIIVQKYISGFLYASMEAYHDYRRTGFPSSLQPAQNADYQQIPTRIPYTDTELNNNQPNVPAGITATSKVWWDTN